MVPPKKMSLQEFFSDESYGGSWADDEIDIASISVPIEKNRGYGYGGESHYGAGGNRFGSSGAHVRSAFLDNGPPYIVKLSNIPVTSNDAFISDLFHSRFTPLVKFKILFDPFSQPLELGIVKKIAFVELPSFESQNKVSKWQDVVYKGSRRVIIEVADFNDFQQSMRFNQENHQELLRVEQTFLSSRPRLGHNDEAMPGRGRPGIGRSPGGMPLDNIQLPGSKHHFGPQLRDRRLSNNEAPHQTTVSVPPIDNSAPKAPAKPKPNPFGSAKPVDVLARLQEIEKNIITYKHTTVRAPWADGNDQKPNVHGSQNSTIPEGFPGWNQTSGPKKSLADILGSSKAKDHTKSPRAASSNSTPKPVVKKPTVLMKKPAVVTPEPQAQAQFAEELDGNVNSVAFKLSQTSIESEKEKSDSCADSPKKVNEVELTENISTQTTPSNKQLPAKTEGSSAINSGTKADVSKTENKNTKKVGTRRWSNRGSESVYNPKDEGSQTSHAFPERRQRRPSNRINEKRPSDNGTPSVPTHERESYATQPNQENDGTISRNTKREPRARRSNRRQPSDKNVANTGAKISADSSGALNTVSTETSLQGPSSGAGSVTPNEERSRGTEPTKRGDRRGRGRGNGRGRGGSRSGRGGSETRRSEGRDKTGEGIRRDGSNTRRTELQKLDKVGNS